MAVNSITFNGVKSTDKGLYVSGNKAFNSAEKEYTKVSVPGRSGDLLLFSRRFKNVNTIYHGIVIDSYADNTEAIRAWLLSADGYCRLEDTYNPNYFRMAVFTGPVDFDTILLEAGETDLTFDCKPQRWLKTGEASTTFNASGTITNPTKFTSSPLIRVYGTGDVTFSNGKITVSTKGTSYIDVDCDIKDCFEGSSNRNSNVSISGWPELSPGSNSVTFGSGIKKVIITPRWWTL